MSADTFDCIALGELLIDFTSAGISPGGNPMFERNPGGAPVNVCAALSKFGHRTGFIGKVGDDAFGRYLASVLYSHNVDTSGLKFDAEAGTTLAFVNLDEKGERSFTFYRNPGADTRLSPDEIDETMIAKSRVFHFGSLSLTDEPARRATLCAIECAKGAGAILSYDPNLRPMLWKDLLFARETMLSVMDSVSILKISLDESRFLTGIADARKGAEFLQKKYSIPLILVTLGEKGSSFLFDGTYGEILALGGIRCVDRTGAGDIFLGAFLHAMLDAGIFSLQDIKPDGISRFCRFANAAAGLSTTKRGGMPSIPGLDEVTAFLS